MGPIPWESRFHWLKSFAVSNINLNREKKIIEIQIDIPVFPYPILERKEGVEEKEEKIEEWKALSTSLAETIKLEFEEELNEVNKVIVYYEDFPLFWGVYYSIQFIPGYQAERTRDLWEVLNNSEIINSPNAGRVINALLKMLEGIATQGIPPQNFLPGDIKSRLQQFKDEVLGGFIAKRPCHVGLRNISKILEEELKKKIDSADDCKRVTTRFQKIYEEYQNIKFDPTRSYYDELKKLISGRKGFLLYGYSSSVASLLSIFCKDKKNVEIIIAECRSKPRYSFENKPLYSDGAQYALLIKNEGFSKIRIIPDTEVATILDINFKKGGSSLYAILLGANGISEEDGSCGHSGGHLNMTIIGRHFEIPVVIIADTLKIGELKPNPELKRGEDWFTTYQPLVAELKTIGVSFSATREDIIPGNMIDLLVTEEGSIPLKTLSERGKNEIKKTLSNLTNKWMK